MPTSAPCRCPACLPSIPPDPATATPAELLAHAGHLRRLDAVGALPDPNFQPYPMQPTPTIFHADEHLAQHLLSLGFTETTGGIYHRARGWRSFYHPARWVSVWLQPERITVQAGIHWRFEANGSVQTEVLDALLTACGPDASPNDYPQPADVATSPHF